VRRDLFLHFLNRDTREIFGVYQTLRKETHQQLMRRALNAAVVLCEDRCIAPPGFIVEDSIAFELAEAQQSYLRERILQFPMREHSLAEFAEKKRVGYEPMRDRYSGLFSDTRIGFLGENAGGIIRRKSRITENILEDWQAAPEARSRIWKPIKKLLSTPIIDTIARIPVNLNNRGIALTWSAIEPEIPLDGAVAARPLRDTLQHIYFQQYCTEFNLIVLTGIPHIIENFQLPAARTTYDYHRLGDFLSVFGLRDIILDAPSHLIVDLRRRPGFIEFVDAYAALSEAKTGSTELKFAASNAARNVRFDWQSVESRRFSLYEVSPVEISELDDVLSEVASVLSRSHNLKTRASAVAESQPRRRTAMPAIETSEPELVLFVALEEELNVLAAELGLAKHHITPEATGSLGDTQVAVVCPRNMGRVAAAVAMAGYLSRRRTMPKLILVVGLAGGFAENGTVEGHVLAVTKVVDLAMRKVTDDSTGAAAHNFRREDYRLSSALEAVVNSDRFDIPAWSTDALKFDWPADRRPSIHFGPVASADEVVSSDSWRNVMLDGKGGHEKLLGVEMEAGGVCAAAERHRIPVCMLRVVSDQADPAKADNSWRRRGMRTLACLLLRLPMTSVLEVA
jgi:nucleoside phosphorylase